MCAQRVQLKTTIDGQQVPLNPYTDCVKNVRQQMPLAGSKLLGTTVLYVGPTTDTYSTGVCYTCKATESSSYYWEAVPTATTSDVDLSVLPTTVSFQSQDVNTRGAVLSVDQQGFNFRQQDLGSRYVRLAAGQVQLIGDLGDSLSISTYVNSSDFGITAQSRSLLSIAAGPVTYTEQGQQVSAPRVVLTGVDNQTQFAGCVRIFPKHVKENMFDVGPALSVEQSGVYWDGVAIATTTDIDTHAALTAASDTLGHIKVDNDTITVDENGVATAHAVGHNIFDIFYSMSSKAPAGAMDLSLGTLIASCDTVFPDFWDECLQRRGNTYMFPQFSGSVYYYWSGDNVIGGEGVAGAGNAVCYYEGKIYVLAGAQDDMYGTPPPQSSLLWRQFIVPTEQWDAQKQYYVGDTVLYSGQIWCARYRYSSATQSTGIAPGTTDEEGYIHWARYDLPTQIIAPSIRILTESEWQAEATANGSCGAFVVDEEAMSVRLPKITHMIQPGDVGVFAEAGLPNITGSFSSAKQLNANYNLSAADGAFYSKGQGGASNSIRVPQTITTDYQTVAGFSASNSNSIYGNSSTVQPPAVGAKLYIQVFTSAVPASMAQAGEFINMLESYLPLSGGTMAGGITSTVEDIVTRGDTTGRLAIHGGTAYHYGASVYLFGKDHATAPGIFAIYANDGTEYNSLIGYPDGRLTWGNVPVLNPAGTVIAFAGNSAPTGYLICNGAAVSRTTYAKLFAIIGTTYGTGDGSTTFNLPNLTNKFIMGSGTAGTSKAAGVPNIKAMFVPIPIKNSSSGTVGSTIISNSGALTMSHETDRSLTGFQISPVTLSSSLYRYNFAASSYSSIYGNSSTVQPPALTMRFYIKY